MSIKHFFSENDDNSRFKMGEKGQSGSETVDNSETSGKLPIFLRPKIKKWKIKEPPLNLILPTGRGFQPCIQPVYIGIHHVYYASE